MFQLVANFDQYLLSGHMRGWLVELDAEIEIAFLSARVYSAAFAQFLESKVRSLRWHPYSVISSPAVQSTLVLEPPRSRRMKVSSSQRERLRRGANSGSDVPVHALEKLTELVFT